MVSGKGLGYSASRVFICPEAHFIDSSFTGQEQGEWEEQPLSFHGQQIPTTAKHWILPLPDFSGPSFGTPRTEVMLTEWYQVIQ